MTLPDFPTDDETLDLLSAALEPDGPSLTGVLDVLSGYDESKVVPLVEDGRVVGGIREYVGGPIYVVEDVVRSLIEEVRNLRRRRPGQFPEPAPASPHGAHPAPVTHPYRLLPLSALLGAATGAFIGWWAGGRKQ